MKFSTLFLALVQIVLVSATLSPAQMNRGVWFWGSTTTPDGPSPYGSITVVGDLVKEDETIAFFTTHGVKRVYGSYQNRPVSDTAAIAAWNQKLAYAFIESQLLLDFEDVDDPAEVADFLVKIENRFINYNADYYDLPQYRFDALHLDIEPQGTDTWDDGDAAVKRAMLTDLKNLYAAIRIMLDDPGIPIGEIWTGPAVYIHGEPGVIYTVKQAQKLQGQWREMAQVHVKQERAEMLKVPIQMTGPPWIFQSGSAAADKHEVSGTGGDCSWGTFFHAGQTSRGALPIGDENWHPF